MEIEKQRMEGRHKKLDKGLIEDLQKFIFDLTGEYACVLSDFETEGEYPSFEVSGWSNMWRRKYNR